MRRRAFSRVEQLPTTGATIELTIDKYLQHIAERELHAAMREHQAHSGTVVVMQPHTGELLALANEPSFNPNAFSHANKKLQRANTAIIYFILTNKEIVNKPPNYTDI